MKKIYEKPTMEMIVLQQQCMILAGSNPITALDITGIGTDDVITIDDTTIGDDFWGR